MPALERLFKSCTLHYTWDNEDEGAFVANWKPLNDSKQIERAKKSKDPWVWQSAWDLKGTPYWGQFASYWGGGNVVMYLVAKPSVPYSDNIPKSCGILWLPILTFESALLAGLCILQVFLKQTLSCNK